MKRYYIYIILILIYIIPENNPSFTINLFIQKTIIFYFLSIFLLMLRVFNKKKISKDYVFFIVPYLIIICIKIYYKRDFGVITPVIYLYVVDFIINNNKNMNLNKIIKLCIISLIFQMFIYRLKGRIVLSYISPNYSGFYLYILYVYLYEKKNKLSILILIMGLLTLSRNFLYAVILYRILQIKIFKYSKIISINIFIIYIVSTLLTIGIGNYIIKESVGKLASAEYTRVFQVKEGSNRERFIANKVFLENFFKDKELFFHGIKSVDAYKKKYNSNNVHNEVFNGLRRFGILYIYILFWISYYVKKIINKNTFPILIGLMLYYQFLGGVFSGINLVLTVIILKEIYKDEDRKNKRYFI